MADQCRLHNDLRNLAQGMSELESSRALWEEMHLDEESSLFRWTQLEPYLPAIVYTYEELFNLRIIIFSHC